MGLRIVARLLVVLVFSLGCGVRSPLEVEPPAEPAVPVDSGAPDADGDGATRPMRDPCLPMTVRNVRGLITPNSCVLRGQGDGQNQRMDCIRTGTCIWYTDGVERCRCNEPNFANVCPNGVPICVGWNLPFDFASDVRFE
jgi:hypothetical protein